MMDSKAFEDAIFDIDGIVTQTTELHAEVWKAMFQNLLGEYNQQDFAPFNFQTEYKKYVDGTPRLDDIRSFLESRDISIREGSKVDTGTSNTIHNTGHGKNKIFLKNLDQEVACVILTPAS